MEERKPGKRRRYGDEDRPKATRRRFEESSSSSGAFRSKRHPEWGKPDEEAAAEARNKESKLKPGEEKEKANFGLSGALNKDENTGKTYKGVVLKWSEPPDAAMPTKRWRLYVFKGEKLLDVYHMHRQSAYLFGRNKDIADVPIEHPSCSGQHAVLQYRIKATPATSSVRPYIMDLESTNGTYLNGKRIDSARYIELLEKDVVRFGESSREYVVILDKD